MQRVFATPAVGLPFAHASVVAYMSLLEGWGRPLVDRRRALSILAWCTRRACRLFGARAGVSLGAVGTGALGDEPVYRALEPLDLDDPMHLDTLLAAYHRFPVIGGCSFP